jgi:sugar phosphate isomerase/epimerase
MPDPNPSTAQPPALNLAVSTLSFAPALDRGPMTLEEVPDAIYPLGLRAIELDDRHLRPSSALKRRALDWLMARYFGDGAFFREYTSKRLLALHQAFAFAGVRLAVWTAHTDFTLAGKAARWQLNYLEGAIAAANDFGARIVCIQSGGPPDPSAEMLSRCAEGLQQAAQLARRFNTRLALQHGSGLACTAERTLRLVRGVNSVFLRVCLDLGPSDMPAERAPGLPRPPVKELAALAPYTIHAHIRSTGTPDDETNDSIRESLAALQAAHYDGWISAVHEGSDDADQGILLLVESIRALSAQ